MKVFFCVCMIGIAMWITLPWSAAQDYFKTSRLAVGVGAGGSHYFGDINPFFDKIAPGMAISAFARYALNHYLAWRGQASYLNMGYTDDYSQNQLRKLRALSFQTNVYELSALLDFHFLKYIPARRGYNFTPYLMLGLGLFYFHSHTFYQGEKHALRPLQTEGVNYSPVQVSLPIGIGLKWGLSKNVNLSLETLYRFTTTDYLDDVSGNYLGGNAFPDPLAHALQDRSGSAQIGTQGRQRGQSPIKDAFMSLQILLSVNLYRYQCPQAILY